MESLDAGSNSLELEESFLTPIELKEIKQMLLSGEKEKIVQSVEKIKFYMTSEKSTIELIKSDICEFLCDAVSPLDGVILETVCNCLESAAGHAEFYAYHHSCFVIESIIRSLYFLLKNSQSSTSVSQCLALLVLIIQGYSTYGVSPKKKTFGNLLQLLQFLLKTNTITLNNKYQTGNLILSFLKLKTLPGGPELEETILPAICSWFNSVNDVLISVHPIREKLILLGNRICHSVMRWLEVKNKSENFPEGNKNSTERSDMILCVCDFVINFGVSYFDSLSLGLIESDSTDLELFYQALFYFYSGKTIFHKHTLSHRLGDIEFIQFTTKVISFCDFDHGENLRNLCMLVLFHVILSLSEDVFQFPKVWPEGLADFQNVTQEGISILPSDPSLWLDFLANPDSSFSSKLALLQYLYFYSMTAKSQYALNSIYPSIVSFINFSEEFRSSVLLVKMVWFVFVVSQLSSSQHSSLDGETEALDKIVHALEAQEDLSVVYTHHPALLYWGFSSKVNINIQIKIVQLWLRNKSPDCRELEELIEKSSDVRFAVLDVLQYESGTILESAFLSLRSILLEKKDENLASNIWFLLPQILAKYTTDSVSATNVDYIIELSSLKIPENLDVTRLIRIASLLPEILVNSSLLSVVPSLTLVNHLLDLGSQMEDFRVISNFIRCKDFLKIVLERIISNISEVSLCCIKIFTVLWRDSQKLDNPESFEKTIIPKEVFVKILEANCIQVLSAALDFLLEILGTNFQSPVFVLTDVDSDFVEVLFLEIQNINVKNLPEIFSKSWRCLKLFLRNFGSELASNPILHELISLHILQLKECQEMKDFLVVWLELNNNSHDECFGRKIYGRFYLDTVQKIADSLSEELAQEQTLCEQILKAGIQVKYS